MCTHGLFPGSEPDPPPGPRRSVGKILFASAHSIVDFSNGASVATLDVLQGLTSFDFGEGEGVTS